MGLDPTDLSTLNTLRAAGVPLVAGQQPINDGDGKPALFPYGFGLTYGAAPPRDPYQAETTSDTGGGLNVGWIPGTIQYHLDSTTLSGCPAAPPASTSST